MTDESEVQHTSIYIPRAVHDRLREIAFNERIEIHDLIMRGLDLVMEERGHPERTKEPLDPAAPSREAAADEMTTILRKIDARLDGALSELREIKQRVTPLELAIGSLAAVEANHYASLSGRLDRVETRLDRIEDEQRLNLTDS